MITTIAQFLGELLERRAKLLDAEVIKHGPTIGNMYEGLTRDILARAIPPAFNVQIVEGFVEGYGGRLSPQIDAMLVAGDQGRQVPHTSSYVWPMCDVLAIFEVKKTLYAEQLADGANKSAAIWEMQQELFRHGSLEGKDTRSSERAFARWAGVLPLAEMSEEDREVYRGFVAEQFCPVRVVFAYQGYASEHGLRSAFLDLIDQRIGTAVGAGPICLPDLIICGQNSLIKMGGHPYVAPRTSEYWDLIGSEREWPLRLLFELVWTRLSNRFETVLPMDDTLDEEHIAPLMSVRSIVEGGQRGWYYRAEEISQARLEERDPVEQWHPVEIGEAESTLFMIAAREGGADVTEPGLIEFAHGRGWDVTAVIENLVAKRLMAWNAPSIAIPITDRTGIVATPDGRWWASSNEEKLLLWVAQYSNERQP